MAMQLITLEPAVTPEHFQFLYCTRRHSRVAARLVGTPPSSYEEHLRYLDRVLRKSHWVFVARTVTKELVGYSQIYDVQEGRFEVGFAVHPDFQGRGYGRMLVNATIEEGSRLFPGRRIVLVVKRDNQHAIHLYETCGFLPVDSHGGDEALMMERESAARTALPH